MRLELSDPLLAAGKQLVEWRKLAIELAAADKLGLSLCASARAMVAGGDRNELCERLATRTVPLTRAESQRRSTELRKARKPTTSRQRPDLEVELASWIQALVDGVEPAQVFGNLAELLTGQPRAGLDFVEAAIQLAGKDPAHLSTRALLRVELGEPEGAFADVVRITSVLPESARWLGNYRRVMYTSFDFWPERCCFDYPANPELPTRVCQPLSQIQRTVSKVALRLLGIRARLGDLVSEPNAPWMPPDPGPLLDGHVELERYTFVEECSDLEQSTSFEISPDVIQVDETLTVEGLGITSLLRLARREWTSLCWLCWGTGCRAVEMPRQLAAPPEYEKAVTTAFYRAFRVADSLQTGGLRSRSRGLPNITWEGMDVDSLAVPLSTMAIDEAFEMRAVLFWLGDAECRSLWQDDLRER